MTHHFDISVWRDQWMKTQSATWNADPRVKHLLFHCGSVWSYCPGAVKLLCQLPRRFCRNRRVLFHSFAGAKQETRRDETRVKSKTSELRTCVFGHTEKLAGSDFSLQSAQQPEATSHSLLYALVSVFGCVCVCVFVQGDFPVFPFEVAFDSTQAFKDSCYRHLEGRKCNI